MGQVGISDFTERRLARLGADAALPGLPLFPPRHSDPVPSPDGTRLAWISDRDGRPSAWLAPLPADGGPVPEPDRPLPFDADVVRLSWSPDGRWLAAETAPFGGERTRVQVVSPDGGEVHELAPGAAAANLGAWSLDGRQLGITVYGDDSGDGQACLVDLWDGTSVVLAAGPAARVCAVSGDGRRAVVRLGRRGERQLELVDLRSGRRTELLPGGANVADARFSVTGRQLYVHTDAGRERPALLAVTLLGQDGVSAVYPIAERPDDDLDLVTLDPSGVRAALVWNVDGRSEVELLDLRTSMLEPLASVPGDVVTGVAFSRDWGTEAGEACGADEAGTDSRALLVASEGPAVSPRLSRVPLDGPGNATPLVPAEPDGAAGTALVTPTLHEFAAEDGLRLSGWLFRPRGAPGPLPTLLWLHGGPEAQERPVFQPLFQAMVAEGVAVFAPNVRGSAGYGRTFTAADDGERRFAAIRDVRAAAGFLVSAGLADPAHLGVSGRSYGGYLTLAALTWFPEMFAVGVDVCGISDFATFYERTEPWIAVTAVPKYGDPDADATLLRELSPIHYADRITAPLLVVHGAHDTNVPVAEAEQVVTALRERGAAPGFLLFDDEGHELHGTENRAVFVREVVRWVTAHLLEMGERTA